jgi:TRAP-type C4-dicarboxylate transport system substrate-binding protein
MQCGIWRNRLHAGMVLGFCLAAFGASAADDVVQLRLATLAPRGTSYHKSLMLMGEKWRQATGGSVRLTIFPGGTQGGEADSVGLMQTGNLDAALLTTQGLSEIEPATTALQSMPMAFRNLEEVEYVGEKLRPLLEPRLAAKGYQVLFWSDSGWIRFFSRSPVVRPDDLRKLKVFSWVGSPSEYDVWKAAGFHPVALETPGIAQGLLSDSINAVPMPPFFALAGQLHNQTKYMLEVNWAPLVGATVVRTKSWNRISAKTREALLKIAADTGRQIRSDGRAENLASVVEMAKRGLVVQKLTPEIETEWRTVVEKVQDKIRGRIVPADMFDEAQRLLKEFRARGGGQAK